MQLNIELINRPNVLARYLINKANDRQALDSVHVLSFDDFALFNTIALEQLDKLAQQALLTRLDMMQVHHSAIERVLAVDYPCDWQFASDQAHAVAMCFRVFNDEILKHEAIEINTHAKWLSELEAHEKSMHQYIQTL